MPRITIDLPDGHDPRLIDLHAMAQACGCLIRSVDFASHHFRFIPLRQRPQQTSGKVVQLPTPINRARARGAWPDNSA